VRSFSFSVVTCALALGWTPRLGAEQVRVRGTSVVETALAVRGREFQISGRVRDETGRPLAGTRLALQLRREAAPSDLALCSPASGGRTRLERRSPRPEYRVSADDEGRFCVTLSEKTHGGAVEIRALGDRLYEPSEAVSIELVPDQRTLELRFLPEPHWFELDQPTHTLWVSARSEPPLSREAVKIELLLLGVGRPPSALGAATVFTGERASIRIPSSGLGEPGPATLVVRSRGSETLGAAERRVRVERTARISLSLARPIEPPLSGRAFTLDVAVGSSRGAVPGGSVEALVGSHSAGAAPVRGGLGHVVVLVDAPYGQTVPVTVRYLADTPWWLPGEPLTLQVQFRSLSAWEGAPWALVVLSIGVWLMRTWRRPRRRVMPPAEPPRPSIGRATVELIHPGPTHGGWQGTVRDAHEGRSLAGASVRILLPTFGPDSIAAQAFTNRAGEFELPHVDARAEGTRVEVRSEWYTTLVRPLPAPGELLIQLVLRRRALLDRLVNWARRVGRPWWTGRQEPTPAEVAAIGRRNETENVARWAEAVERAAYGPDPVDEAEEQRVQRLEPHGGPAPQREAIDAGRKPL
jgi:hypothetical protein